MVSSSSRTPTWLDITIDRIEVTSIRTINPRAMPTILRRIDWLKIGMGARQRLKDGTGELTTPDLAAGTCAIWFRLAF